MLRRPVTFSGTWTGRHGGYRSHHDAASLSLDMKKLMVHAVDVVTDGEVPNVKLLPANSPLGTQIFNIFVMCCEANALRTLERAVDTEVAVG